MTTQTNIPDLRGKIKIAFFDIDETLIVKDEDYLPDSVHLVMQGLKANGIIPAIASGRALCSFPPKIKALVEQHGLELFVTMNGQYVRFQDKVIEKHPIPTEKIHEVTEFFKAHNIDYAFVSESDFCVSNITDFARAALDPLKTAYHIEPDYYLRHDVYQILPFYDESLDDFVSNSGVLGGLKTVRWHENSVDLFDAQGSKARGIQAVINHFGLKAENVIAFGDEMNDFEMMQMVGTGVAMGNGNPKLQAVADYVTDHIKENGLYNFLKKANLI